MSVLPLRADKYTYRADGDFFVRCVCRACEAKYDTYALAHEQPYCDDCLRIKKHMELLYQAKRAPKPSLFRTWGAALLAFSVMVGVCTFLIWGGVSGYKYVDGVVNAIKEALR